MSLIWLFGSGRSPTFYRPRTGRCGGDTASYVRGARWGGKPDAPPRAPTTQGRAPYRFIEYYFDLYAPVGQSQS